MAATLAEVLKDPNYVNANAATKAAIFDKFSAKDSNYTNANDATKAAIRNKFGVEAPAESPIMAPPVEVRPDAIPERDMMQRYGFPVLEAVGATVGGIVGGVPGTVFGPAGTVAGAATGAGLGYGAVKELERLYDERKGTRAPQSLPASAAEAAENVLLGATFEVGGRVILPPVAKAAGWLWDRATGKLVQIKAGKIVQELAGDQLEALKAATKAAPEGLTGAQAAAGVEAAPIQTLGLRAAERAPYTYRPLEQAAEAGRKETLAAVTPSKPAAEAARTAVSEPLYREAAETVVTIDPKLKTILDRLPEGTINAARNLAKLEGRPFTFGEAVPGVESATRVGGTPQITGESLHYIKRALSDIANSQATKNVGKDVQRATQNVLNEYLKAVETRVPAYGQARLSFAEASKPVNQSVVLNEMRAILEAPGGGERAKPFINALGKGEQALLKKATGYARYEEGDLAKVLTPEQMTKVTQIANELVRDLKMAEQAKAGNVMYESVLRENVSGPRLPNILSAKVAVTNETLNILENRVNKKVMKALTEGMRTGKTLNELLNVVPSAQRSEVLNVIQNDARMQRAITFGANALVETENRNALAE
jgi:hypothetical protein